MAKAKQPAARWSARLTETAGFLRGPGRPVAIGLVVLATFFGVWYYVWQEVRAHVVASPGFQVTVDALDITPLPAWIHSDVRAEVYQAAKFGGPLSILDDNLTERLAAAFSLHPWVAKVRRVTKQHPARVVIELDYRRPMLMVDTLAGLLPVDAEGVLLPGGDFSPVEQSRYPRLVGVDSQPMGTAGERWGDPRVFGAAQIIAALGERASAWRIDRVVPSIKPAGKASDDYLFVLITRSGSQLYWGRGQTTSAGELPTSEKLARLEHYFAAHGTFDGLAGPQQLDIRNMTRP